MSERSFGVGLIGVEANRSWAALVHLPAILAQPRNVHIAGIANSSKESGRRAANACGIDRAFADVDALIASDSVDIVAVTVKVPAHYSVVERALRAGKHVYCEWPLGKTLDEARRLASLARDKDVLAVAGTQARVSPVMVHVRQLIADGYVGEVLSTTLLGRGDTFGDAIPKTYAYAFDAANGSTMLTVQFGHAMAAILDVLGPISAVSARLDTRKKTVTIMETGEKVEVSSPDQVLVQGLFSNGAPIAAHYRGGVTPDPGLQWEIIGTEGCLQITGGSGHAQLSTLSIRGRRGNDTQLVPLDVPTGNRPFAHLKGVPLGAITVTPENVALMYERMSADLRTGSRTAPSFDDAVQLHEFIDAVQRSARSGAQESFGAGTSHVRPE